MKRLVPIFLLFTVSSFSLMAQNTMPFVVNAAGGTFKNGNDIYEWSVGELALINEMQSADKNVIITNGFFQTYIWPGTKDSLIKPITGEEVAILPNPTKGKLQVNFAFGQPGKLKLMVCNELGFIMYQKQFFISASLASETINMEKYANGNYFLVIEMIPNYATTKKQQTFKIIKIH